jgi:hypothetical protein
MMAFNQLVPRTVAKICRQLGGSNDAGIDSTRCMSTSSKTAP